MFKVTISFNNIKVKTLLLAADDEENAINKAITALGMLVDSPFKPLYSYLAIAQ